MRILWLSWRDIKNPQAGGAEKVAWEIAKRMVKNGHKVTIFSSLFKKAKPKEKTSGVQIIRNGNRITCHLFHFLYYFKNKRQFDLVIDEINTIPSLTPLYAPKKSVAFIHQLAREYWFSQTFFPLNYIGSFLEPFYLSTYRKTPTITVSNSTRDDLIKLGFNKIKVIREGLDISPKTPKSKADLILFIGRLTPAKNPKDAINAFKLIKDQLKTYVLMVIGTGDDNYIRDLKSKVKNLKLAKSVQFLGRVDEKTKVKLLLEAKIILIPSIREGWSLVATEANATGCVPIAYNVGGLRDSVISGKTGVLVEKSPENLAQAAINLLSNEPKRSKLQKNGQKFAKNFSWDNTYEDFIASFRPAVPSSSRDEDRKEID